MFFLVREDLQDWLIDLVDRYEIYQKVCEAKKVLMRDVIRQLARKIHKIDVGSDEAIWIRLNIGKTMVTAISLRDLLFQKVSPSQFFERERNRIEEDMRVEAYVGGTAVTLKNIDSVIPIMKLEDYRTELRAYPGITRKNMIHSIIDFFPTLDLPENAGHTVAAWGEDAAVLDLNESHLLLFAADGIMKKLMEKV